MLSTSTPSSGLLFGSFLYRNDLFGDDYFEDFWEGHFGKSFSSIPDFNPLIEYYSQEMGDSLSRVFFLTGDLFTREHLLLTKLQSLDWENKWAINNKRMVNIDIGYLSLENFLLATTKNFSHRIYLGQNIFSDLTYYFHLGELRSLPWTYPDFLDSQKKNFLNWGRSFLLQTLSK